MNTNCPLRTPEETPCPYGFNDPRECFDDLPPCQNLVEKNQINYNQNKDEKKINPN